MDGMSETPADAPSPRPRHYHRLVVAFTAILFSLGATAAPAEPPRDRPLSVGILLFDGVQLIDFTGPYEVFEQAGLRVWTASADGRPIDLRGMVVTPVYTLAEAPPADILVIPGGDVPHRVGAADPRLEWILERSAGAEVVLSICNGVFYLASAGLLDGLRATTYAPMLSHLRMVSPAVEVVADERFVDNGRFVTAGGLSAGIDGALHVVRRLLGEGMAREVANNMEYDWRPASPYVRANLADLHIQEVIDFNPPLSARVTEVYVGDEERWQLRYRVRWPREVAEMRRQFVDLARAAGWSRRGGDASGDPESIDWSRTEWDFRGRRGESWTAAVAIAACAAAGEIVLSVEVERAPAAVGRP